ncbi:hydroxymethylbilane synthase [Aeoliella mucimassa]|uniref:hydroxymethylbilane synthase n=1 Tax=Aeoliella mucimassa TaxID=2527972 RepID=UPI0018D360A9|nr:hydroxymethylbilane synthase [Aeoliella mucimassa]
MHQALRLGTRGSKLARWQADWTAAELRELGHTVEIVEITTTGDANQSHDLGAIGSVGLFTKEIQRALLDKVVDLAVHSLKDLPTTPVEGLTLAAIPERAEVNDALVSREGAPLLALPPDSIIGTGSLRRRSQLLRLRPDFKLADIRGNVDTRLRKLDEGEFDAIILAAAGLMRLGLAQRITQLIPPEQMLPAPAQGALGLECRAGDQRVLDALAPLNHAETDAAATAERAMLARVEGGCLAAIGAYATVVDGQLTLNSTILSGDGSQQLSATATGAMEQAQQVGEQAGDALLAQGAAKLVQERR